MSATNGSTRPRTGRMVGLALALVLALSALFASAASATVPVKESYMPLGDSLAFGYSTQKFNENFPTESPTAFERGYDHFYFNHLKPGKEGVQEQNKGCPGETTDSMIGNGPLGAALEAGAGATTEAPCAYHYLAGLPLHHEYGGTKSQLENALETLYIDQEILAQPVTTLSVNIGSNDQLHQVKACEKEVGEEWEKEGKSKYGGETPTQSFEFCLVAHVEPLFKHILTNLGASLYALRKGAEFGSVNYTGKLVVQGYYDPYGAVFVEGKELLNNSNNLVAALNSEEQAVVGKFGACYANPQPIFNPRNKREPERLQKFTNMANFTEFEGKKNGPDIHPTPVGYAKLANIMIKACGKVE